jgi:hypothetical protein
VPSICHASTFGLISWLWISPRRSREHPLGATADCLLST